MPKRIFITGIGTDVGKTIAAAVLAEAWAADYWKPVQAGDLHDSDSMKIKEWISNGTTIVHPEMYRLSIPASPHFAAEQDGVKLSISDLKIPETENTLIIEGAGGLMVPLNREEMMVDMIEALKAKVILVSRNYLGAINHTLLSTELLKQRGIDVMGIVFNGEEYPSGESLIAAYSGVKVLGHIPLLPSVNLRDAIKETSKNFQKYKPDVN